MASLFDKIKFDSATFKSIQALDIIPILTTEMVRQNYEKLKKPNFKSTIVHDHTSGSTVKSLNFHFIKMMPYSIDVPYGFTTNLDLV